MKIPDIPYRTPVIRYDPLAQVQIFENRNPATGVVSFQTPSPEAVKLLEEGGRSTASASGTAPRISVLV